MGLLSGLVTILVLLVVVERNATSAYPQTVTGKFMGFDSTGSAMAFQPDGSPTGTSYAWSAATLWYQLTAPHTAVDPSPACNRPTAATRSPSASLR
jgi:hypothetical protein